MEIIYIMISILIFYNKIDYNIIFIISILKSLVIPAIWLALSSVIYSQIRTIFLL